MSRPLTFILFAESVRWSGTCHWQSWPFSWCEHMKSWAWSKLFLLVPSHAVNQCFWTGIPQNLRVLLVASKDSCRLPLHCS